MKPGNYRLQVAIAAFRIAPGPDTKSMLLDARNARARHRAIKYDPNAGRIDYLRQHAPDLIKQNSISL